MKSMGSNGGSLSVLFAIEGANPTIYEGLSWDLWDHQLSFHPSMCHHGCSEFCLQSHGYAEAFVHITWDNSDCYWKWFLVLLSYLGAKDARSLKFKPSSWGRLRWWLMILHKSATKQMQREEETGVQLQTLISPVVQSFFFPFLALIGSPGSFHASPFLLQQQLSPFVVWE